MPNYAGLEGAGTIPSHIEQERVAVVWRQASGLRLSSREHPRVLVLHRRLLVAQVLAKIVSAEPAVAWSLGSDDIAHAAFLAKTVDVVILDTATRRPDGSELLGELVALPTGAIILCLGGPEDDAVRALLQGARGWVPDDASPEVLVEALAEVSRGHVYLPQKSYVDVVDRLVHARSRQAGLRSLTNRQRAVLECLGQGMSIHETAAALSISPNTVRTHRTRLFAKLGVRSVVEAVENARDKGLPHR